MAHTVTFNPELGIIETVAQGKLTLREAKEIISEIAQIALEKDCFLCLSDYRAAIMGMSTLEIHDVPKILSDIVTSYGLHPGKFKRAVVVKQGFSDFHFFETVTINTGQNLKLFQALDDAKNWLLEK